MASPQVEEGYTRVANELLEALCRYKMPAEQLRVVLWILRNTYGRQQKTVTCSLAEIAEGTGLMRQNVHRTLADLSSRMITVVIKGDYKRPQTLGINKDYEQWRMIPKKQSVVKDDYRSVVKDDYRSKIVPLDERKKRNTPLPPKSKKPKTEKPPLPEWIDPETWAAWKEFRQKIKAPLTERATVLCINKLDEFRKNGDDPNAVIDQSIERGWRGLFSLKRENGKAHQARAEKKQPSILELIS